MTMTPATQQAYDMTNRAQEITPDLFGRFVSFLDAAPATVRKRRAIPRSCGSTALNGNTSRKSAR